MRSHLVNLARAMGIPRTVVDALPVEELQAAAEQTAMCGGHHDGHGDPLAQSLLVFYLKALAREEG